MKYDFKKIESKWQKVWQNEGVYEPNLKEDKNSTLRPVRPAQGKRAQGKKASPFYNLMMFPYPSAEGLHVGNAYAFVGSDIYGRFRRMNCNDVFEPIGLDGFGIHSENYALKIGVHPAKQAKISEKRFYKQLASLGNGFSWDEKLETYDPAYYKWTQWIFTQLFKKGLAYRKKQPVNWCPSCKTVLADEQVIQKRQETRDKRQGITFGVCERCDTKVIKKELEQWFFKITDYAEKLLKNIDGLDWSEKVKVAQRNWLGKSEGAEIDFEIKTKEKPNFVLLHGYNGSPKGNFRPWLKKELEKKGYKVSVPALPNSKNPKVAEQVEYVLKHAKFDKNTVLLGHSLGAIVALKVLEKLKQPVWRSVLVAGFVENKFLDHDRFDENTFDWKFNAKRIRANVGDLHILRDTTDEVVPPDQAKKLQNLFGGAVAEFAAQEPHMCGKQEPEVLRSCVDSIRVFTTRPDTLFGATYMVLSPENPLIQNLESRIQNLVEVKKYIKKAKAKSEEEKIAEGQVKTGVELKGIKAINPANGKEIPIWIADYVLTGYGTGAIMAVPAHDERDFEFAKKYRLPIINVIEPETGKSLPNEEYRRSIVAIVEDVKTGKFLTLNWGQKLGGTLFIGGGIENGEDEIKAAIREIKEETGYIDVKFVAKTERMHHHYFAFSKNVGRNINAVGLHFHLSGDKKEDTKLQEYEKFEIEWLTKEEILQKVEDENHILSFRRLILGEIYIGSGKMANSGKFNGLDSETAKWEITKFVGGKRKTQFRLRDWLISRQRYWGAPIPMVYCEKCAASGKGERKEMPGWYSVPENKLPVKLPFVKDFRPKGTGKSPLATVKSFYETKCPKCGGKARRETDVSDTFLDSAWYFLRYPSTRSARSGQVPWDKEITKKWLPVNMYIGGAEHSVLHLLYSRFLTMFFKDIKLTNFDEPFTKFRAHGLLIKEGAKMSKSKGNVVNPDKYIKNFGADTLRMYLMFLAPFEQGGDFRDAGILGIKRFLERVWKMGTQATFAEHPANNRKIKQALHATIKKVTEDIGELRYNTAISALMILLNEFEANPGNVTKDDFENFLKLLAPFAPHITEELWYRTQINADGHADKRRYISENLRSNQRKSAFRSIHLEKWPEYDKNLAKSETFTLVIQVNGKVRDSVEAPSGIGKEEAEKLALNSEKVKNIIKSGTAKKTIYVPGRLINLVV
ncbi:MAG: alpha/beta fold hydrolase [Patescibacteria group bacterium]